MDHVAVLHGRHQRPEELEVTVFGRSGQACPDFPKFCSRSGGFSVWCSK